MVKEKDKPAACQDVGADLGRSLVLHNDDVNSFEFVIETLIEVCNHDPYQAEQCALIAHMKGKCEAKSGSFKALKPLSVEMTQRGLTVSIESLV
jgi:ATP-dependent Clp protease adaptor protein ClpS